MILLALPGRNFLLPIIQSNRIIQIKICISGKSLMVLWHARLSQADSIQPVKCLSTTNMTSKSYKNCNNKIIKYIYKMKQVIIPKTVAEANLYFTMHYKNMNSYLFLVISTLAKFGLDWIWFFEH